MVAVGQKQNFKLKHYRNIVSLDRKISSLLRNIGDNIVIPFRIIPNYGDSAFNYVLTGFGQP